MAKRIFVSATNTDIGKTYTTKLLLKEFASRGFRVGVFKPIETGVEKVAHDALELLAYVKEVNYEFKEIDIEDIAPITYRLPAAPYVASNNEEIDFKKIDSALEKLEKLCDILIIEGAGGLYVPIDDKYMMIDLISYFKAYALLVTHCSLGCINDTLLSKKALEDKKLPYTIVFNCKEREDDSFSQVSEPYFTKNNFEVLKVSENIDTICDVLYNYK